MNRGKKKKWPIAVGILVVLILVAYVWTFGTGRIDVQPTVVPGADGTRSIVVYFTRVGETKAGVDAISAATPNTNSGNTSMGDTEAAARLISGVTGADRVQLYTARYYRDSFAGTAARALVERYLNLRPDIVEKPDLAGYDTVYIGYPIWWFNAPMAVATFLQSADLEGKTVIPFCTSQDNGVEMSMDLIRNSAKGATVLDGMRLHGATAETVQSWLNDIGIIVEEG